MKRRIALFSAGFFVGIIGLTIYLLVRGDGELADDSDLYLVRTVEIPADQNVATLYRDAEKNCRRFGGDLHRSDSRVPFLDTELAALVTIDEALTRPQLEFRSDLTKRDAADSRGFGPLRLLVLRAVDRATDDDTAGAVQDLLSTLRLVRAHWIAYDD